MNKLLFISLFVLQSVFARPEQRFYLEDSVRIFHYHSSKEYTPYTLDEVKNVVKHQSFDEERPTVLYIYGHGESHETPEVKMVIDAYHQQGTHNVLVLDWNKIANDHYFTAAMYTSKIGKVVAEVLNHQIKEQHAEKLHLVGHNLGAHLAGYVGRTLNKLTNGRKNIHRITGLDPALLMFYPENFGHLVPLDHTAAKHVDIIHTDANLYGIPKATGHLDFWPNGGYTLQPGCPRRDFVPLSDNDLCSTRKSVMYWADAVRTSVTKQKAYLAVRAESWNAFKNGHVEKSKVVVMGPYTEFDKTKYGNYFFQTKASMPYGKGVEGIVYDPREDNVDEKHMKKITSPHWTVDPYHHLKNMEHKYDSTESSEETLGLENLFSTNEYKRRFPYVDSMESNEEIISKVPWAVRSMYRSNNDEKYGLRRGRSYNIDNYRNDEKRYRDIDSHDYLKHLVHTDDSIEVARPYYKKHSNYQQSKRYNKPQYDSYGVEEYMNIHNGRYPINEDSYEEIARRYNNDDSIESYRYSNLDKYDQMVLKADHVKVDPRGHKSYKGLNTYPILRRQNAKINYV